MTLITILVCIAIQRFANVGDWFRTKWFEDYLRFLHPWTSKVNEWLGIAMILVPVIVVLGGVGLLSIHHAFSVFILLFTIIIFLFCADFRDPKQKLANYFSSLEKQDLDGANKAATEYVEAPTSHEISEMSRSVTKTIFLKAFTDVFSILFWFILLGICGAAGYFVISLTARVAKKADSNYASISRAAENILNVLDWVPARLIGFSYALSGNFIKGFNFCLKNTWLGLKENQNFAVNSGLAALDINNATKQVNETENLAAIDIINRSLIIWIVAALIFSLGRWL